MVIPTLNSEGQVGQLLETFPLNTRCVVSDGGSFDKTLEVALRYGAVIATGTSGRGSQLRRGVLWAAEETWVLILHADSTLSPDFMDVCFDHIKNHADKAGYFDLKFDSPNRTARLIEWCVQWRCKLFGLPYGDQGLLISRKLYHEVGGFDPVPLFEDVGLVRKIGKARLRSLGAPILTGADKFERDGFFRRGWRNFRLLRRYLKGALPEDLVREYR